MNSDVNHYFRYRVELLVGDGNDNATFVVFDREMLKLTTQDAAGLTLDEVCNLFLEISDNCIDLSETLFNFLNLAATADEWWWRE